VRVRATRRLARRLLVALIVALVVALAGPRFVSAPAPTAARKPPSAGVPVEAPARSGTVTRVYDGDTIEVSGVGKVRLIGIDAPDGYNLERALSQAHLYGLEVEQVKAWADRATEFARQTLAGQAVALHYGEERKDGFDRTLAYVHVESRQGDEDFSLLILRQGLAAAYRGFDHPRRDLYLQAEAKAKAARAGMWKDAVIQP